MRSRNFTAALSPYDLTRPGGREGRKEKKMTAAEKYTLKQRNLKTEFAEQYSLWREAGYVDDRAIFCNIYEIYLESCEDMKAVENIHIQCAVNARLSDDIQTLRKIYSRFQ